MTETAEKKTKRKYLELFRTNEWTHQTTIFYKSLETSKQAANHSAKLKKNLSRAFKFTMLHRIQLKGNTDTNLLDDVKDKKYVTTAYHTFFSLEPFDKNRLEKIAVKALDSDVNIKSRKLEQHKRESIAESIQKQNPHNLNRFFKESNMKKIHRFSLLNKGAFRGS